MDNEPALIPTADTATNVPGAATKQSIANQQFGGNLTGEGANRYPSHHPRARIVA